MYHPDNSFAASPVISLSTASSLSRQVSLSLPSALCLLPGELNISEEREKREKQELKEKRNRERREEVIERYSVIGFLVKVGWRQKFTFCCKTAGLQGAKGGSRADVTGKASSSGELKFCGEDGKESEIL